MNHSSSPAKIRAIIGTDDGMVREVALKTWQEFTNGVDDGFTHETIEGNAVNADDAAKICSRTIEALNTYPMFGGDKVVWLKNATFLGSDRTSDAETTQQAVERLKNELERGLGANVRFIISAPKMDKRRALRKFLEKTADVSEHDKIDISQDGWEEKVAFLVRNQAKNAGISFTHDALSLFVNLVGEGTGQINNEIEKIKIYIGENRTEVTEDDVAVMTPLSREGIVFEVGKALQTGNASRAIRLINEQLFHGESGVAIMRAGIINTVRNLYFSRVILEKCNASADNYNAFQAAINRLPAADTAWLPQKKSGDGVNVYPLFLCAKTAQRYKLNDLEKIFHATAKADKDLVTTRLDERLILHRLVTEIASLASGTNKPPAHSR